MSQKVFKKRFWPFIWSSSRLQVGFTLGAFLLVIVLVIVRLSPSKWWSDTFANYLDPAIAIGTLIVAGMVWWNEKRENWRATWPKKLDVMYLIKKGEVWKSSLLVLDAPLGGEADIRQWGLSIAQTVVPSHPGRIEFSGFKIIPEIMDSKSKVRHHGLMIFLKSKIEAKEKDRIRQFDEYGADVNSLTKIPTSHPVNDFLKQIPKPKKKTP